MKSNDRYLQARIVVLRPILADYYLKQIGSSTQSGAKKGSLSQHLIAGSAEICFEAAHEMIDVLYTHFNFETVTGPVPAWWFAVLCQYPFPSQAYARSTCVVLTRRSYLHSRDSASSRTPKTHREQVKNGWNMAEEPLLGPSDRAAASVCTSRTVRRALRRCAEHSVRKDTRHAAG